MWNNKKALCILNPLRKHFIARFLLVYSNTVCLSSEQMENGVLFMRAKTVNGQNYRIPTFTSNNT